MRVFHSNRALAAGLTCLVTLLAGAPRAAAQVSPTSSFTIYVRSIPIGVERVYVERSADGWTISSNGRIGSPVELDIRQFTARYDPEWRPVELSVDATMRGQFTMLRTSVQGTTATTRVTVASLKPIDRTDTIDEHAILLPNPFIAPYEALAARTAQVPPGTTLYLYQPGLAPSTAIVGASTTVRVKTVDRVIAARRTMLTFQTATAPPMEAEIWGDEQGRLLRLRIPAQTLEVAREDMTAVSTRSLTLARPNDLDVRIPAMSFSLSGTLSRPEDAPGALPAVVLVGSEGPVDRDGVASGTPYLAQIANALADAGFAVLRYDKRGVGQSGGRPESATLADYAEDLRAAVKMLGSRKDIDKRHIIAIGHGEGAAVALLAASKEKRIAAVGVLGGTALTGSAFNLFQVERSLERSSRSPAERQTTIDLQKSIQQAVLTGKGWEQITVSPATRRQADTPYFQSVLAFDPARVIKNVGQPLLIMEGELDKQVPPGSADALEALARARKKGEVDVVKVPGANHLLVPAETGEADEYQRLRDAEVSPQALDALAGWVGKVSRM
ncbi:MAG: alpha/beta hydrolase [Vicinamibacterales bacterium]